MAQKSSTVCSCSQCTCFVSRDASNDCHAAAYPMATDASGDEPWASSLQPFAHPNQRRCWDAIRASHRRAHIWNRCRIAVVHQWCFAGWSLGVLRTFSPLGLRGTAVLSFGLALSVIVLLTLVSEGGFRKGELTTAVPSFFAFYAFFFGMIFWLFA
jgi:hypothetical protein